MESEIRENDANKLLGELPKISRSPGNCRTSLLLDTFFSRQHELLDFAIFREQSDRRDKNILGLARVPYDLRFFVGFLWFSWAF